jgi:dTDP-glucose 4,6-dehydratase
MNILVTGGAGFIGSNFIDYILKNKSHLFSKVVNLDALTYAADLNNVKEFEKDKKYFFENVNLCNYTELLRVIKDHEITHVIHFAAESHVDNSISDPTEFIQSNIVGTFNLLSISRQLNVKKFHHVSTDEVYGELGESGKFNENTPYDPQNPYSATKASSDFLVKSYHHTYKLPITISNCCNNYGPRQHSEKFIPTVLRSLMQGKKIPLYGKGLNIRDWIYVEDHCAGVWEVFESGKLGETYCIGSNCEKKNVEVIKEICKILNKDPDNEIEYVTDRAGHDYRYAIDNSKMVNDLGWNPETSFGEGLSRTIKWYEKYYEKKH